MGVTGLRRAAESRKKYIIGSWCGAQGLKLVGESFCQEPTSSSGRWWTSGTKKWPHQNTAIGFRTSCRLRDLLKTHIRHTVNVPLVPEGSIPTQAELWCRGVARLPGAAKWGCCLLKGNSTYLLLFHLRTLRSSLHLVASLARVVSLSPVRYALRSGVGLFRPMQLLPHSGHVHITEADKRSVKQKHEPPTCSQE